MISSSSTTYHSTIRLSFTLFVLLNCILISTFATSLDNGDLSSNNGDNQPEKANKNQLYFVSSSHHNDVKWWRTLRSSGKGEKGGYAHSMSMSMEVTAADPIQVETKISVVADPSDAPSMAPPLPNEPSTSLNPSNISAREPPSSDEPFATSTKSSSLSNTITFHYTFKYVITVIIIIRASI